MANCYNLKLGKYDDTKCLDSRESCPKFTYGDENGAESKVTSGCVISEFCDDYGGRRYRTGRLVTMACPHDVIRDLPADLLGKSFTSKGVIGKGSLHFNNKANGGSYVDESKIEGRAVEWQKMPFYDISIETKTGVDKTGFTFRGLVKSHIDE